MNKKLILSAVAAAVLAITPLGVKKMIDNSIEQKKIELNNIGVSLSIENDKGYINSERDFNLTIKDEKKFKEYFKNILTEVNPISKVFFNKFSNADTKDFDEFIKGIVFKGNIQNSNLNPFSDIKVYTYLHTLSDKVMNDIKKDKSASEAFLPLFEKELIALNMLFDNNSELKTLVLKDIKNISKHTSKIGTSESSVDLQGFNVVNNSSQNKLIANIGLDSFKSENNFKNKEIESKTETLLEGLNYNINYENQFINNIDMKVKSIKVKSDNKLGMNVDFNLGESNIATSGNITNEIYSTNSDVSIQNLKLVYKKTKIILNKFNLIINLNDMDYKSLKKLSEIYIDSLSQNIDYITLPKEQRVEKMRILAQNLMERLGLFLNKGLSLKIESNLEGLDSNAIKLDNATFNLDAQLKKNDINVQKLNRNPFLLLSLLNINANLEMPEEDYISLSKNINPGISQMAHKFVKKENGKAVFSLKLENGKAEINGHKVN